jgi:hypothetical protein
MGNRKVPGKGSQRPGFRSRIAARWRCLCSRSVSRGSHGSSCCDVRSSTACSWRRVLRTQWLQAWSQSPGPAAMSLSASYALTDFSIRLVLGHFGKVIWSEPRLHFGLRVPIGIAHLTFHVNSTAKQLCLRIALSVRVFAPKASRRPSQSLTTNSRERHGMLASPREVHAVGSVLGIKLVLRRLHPQGADPGLSDEDDSTVRLHLVLLVGRQLLRRV